MMSEIRTYLDEEDVEIKVGQVWECVADCLSENTHGYVVKIDKTRTLKITSADRYERIVAKYENNYLKITMPQDQLHACFKLVKE